MQFLSNLGHWIEGGILGGVAVLALVQGFGLLQSKKYFWPGLILFAGLFLPPYMLLHHGVAKLGMVWNATMDYPQQRQHFIMALLLLIAGIAEIASRKGEDKIHILRFVWPAALVTIGVLFFIHKQHGTHEAVAWAVTVHRLLGALLILSGVLRAGEIVYGRQTRWLAYPWAIVFLASAIFLLSYREPEGTYKKETPSHQHSYLEVDS